MCHCPEAGFNLGGEVHATLGLSICPDFCHSEFSLNQTILSLYSRDVLLQEVDADGLLVVLGEDALAVALYHARLAHRPVPHYHNLQRERWNWMMIGKGGRE